MFSTIRSSLPRGHSGKYPAPAYTTKSMDDDEMGSTDKLSDNLDSLYMSNTDPYIKRSPMKKNLSDSAISSTYASSRSRTKKKKPSTSSSVYGVSLSKNGTAVPPPLPPRPIAATNTAELCITCGQVHSPDEAHLYEYRAPVDEDLTCHICLQPLLDPVDTRCGHTFCSLCITNYLCLQMQCPVDRCPLSEGTVQQSSIMVRRLLDKLLVVCPNIDYCEEVLPRSDLEAHLAHRCKGSSTRCLRADAGCNFRGPRSTLSEHLWECPYRNHAQDLSTDGKMPVVEGDITTIDIQRGCYDLGITIVGGTDTPLMCVVIQDVFQDGVVHKDGRLLPGDQILEVNGLDLTSATHNEAKCALSQIYPITRLTVYREKSEEYCPIEKEEVIRITLPKSPGKPLGLKLVGKIDVPGLFIVEAVTGGTASVDNRLRKDDQILQINGQDVTYASQEQAAHLIHTSKDKVQLVIRRRTRSQSSPDLIQSTAQSNRMSAPNVPPKDPAEYQPIKPCKEKHVAVKKDPNESLGISVVGGCGNPRGDLPIYVTNLQIGGCLHRSKQVQKGDILVSINGHSLLERSHMQAVSILKAAAEESHVTLKVLEGPETSDGIANFIPSWRFWLSMPIMCQSTRNIKLKRSGSGALGFSIVGGADSSCGPVPIYVKSVVYSTSAGSEGHLRSGDQLVSVNGQSLDVAHAAAVDILKHAGESVSLVVVSWPGTPV